MVRRRQPHAVLIIDRHHEADLPREVEAVEIGSSLI